MLGRFKGRVIGLGPILGYTLKLAGKIPIDLTVKYNFEFADQNRSSGDELWLTGSFHF
jgi:hypothetical protein